MTSANSVRVYVTPVLPDMGDRFMSLVTPVLCLMGETK